MALGLIETDKLIRSAAAGIGNIVVLFGAKTGRDGIGGASVLASAELDDSEDKRPTVQIGDPFTEKKLLECSLELLDRGLLVALQDLGAAGLTSSSSEMAAKGEVGLDLEVRKVPLREADMEPFEIMVSESQERMLCVVEPSKLQETLAVCAKWEVDGTAIGKVTDTRRLRVFDDGALVGDMPVTALVDECPAYDLEPAEPSTPLYPAPVPTIDSDEPAEILVALLGSSNVASRKWAFEQYDALVGSRTVRRPEQADAAVLMLPTPGQDPLTALYPADGDGPRRAIAVAIDGNGRRVAADPYRGAVEAVLECSANLACVGAEPLGLTNCLNFGNPEKPHIAWQLTRAVAGPRRRLPGVRDPGRGRQRLALQRGRRRPDLPDARRRAGRRAAGRASRRSARLRGRGRRDRARDRGLGAVAGRLGAVQAARRGGRGAAPGGRPGRVEGAARRDPPGRPLRRPALRARRRRGWRRDRAGRGLPRVRARRHGFRSVV